MFQFTEGAFWRNATNTKSIFFSLVFLIARTKGRACPHRWRHTCAEISPPLKGLKNAARKRSKSSNAQETRCCVSPAGKIIYRRKRHLSFLYFTRRTLVDERGRRVREQFVFAGIRRDGRKDAPRISETEGPMDSSGSREKNRYLSQDVCQCLTAMYLSFGSLFVTPRIKSFIF